MQLLQALQVHIKRFTGMLKGFGQGCPTGNDVWHVGKIDGVGWCLRLVRDGEDIAAILVCGSHRFRASKNLWCSSTSCCQCLPRSGGWQRLTFLLIHSYDLFDNIAEFSKDGLFIVAMTPTIK